MPSMNRSQIRIVAYLIGSLIISIVTIKILIRADTHPQNPAPINSTEKLPSWDLSDLYKGFDDPAWEKDKQQIKKDAEAFNKQYKGLFKTTTWTSNDLLKAIQEYEKLSDRLYRIGTYSVLRYETALKDQDILAIYQQTQEELTELSNNFIFFTIELNDISDAALQTAYEKNKPLQHYKPFFDKIRVMKPYQRSEEVEKVMNDQSITASAAWSRLHDEIETDMVCEIDGKKVMLNLVWEMLSDPDPIKRKKGALALSQVLEPKKKFFAFILNMIIKDKEIDDNTRGFKNPVDHMNLSNQIEGEVVEALVKAVRSSFQRTSHRYYTIKKKMLGLETFEYWDRNAALPNTNTKYTWDETREIVLDAYNKFSPKMATLARNFYDKNWIDAGIKEGKNPGAFCSSVVPSLHPYVLLSFNGKFNDVLTTAHELGHGVHFLLSAHQGLLLSFPPLTLAETASIFGEMLTFQSLLSKTNTLNEKQSLLASKIDAMISTIIRQVSFHLFELEVHKKRREGELKIEDLNKIWMDTQKEALGPSVHIDKTVEGFWAYVPHFVHAPFYVYSYAFADCLVNSLYAVYQKNPDGFEEKYIELLSSGGSKRHKELLAPFGLDATDPNFWQQGLSMLERMIDELEIVNAQIEKQKKST